MRVLITGGTGFIGSRLSRIARLQGHEVVATGLCRSATEEAHHRFLASAGIEIRVGDLDDPAYLERLVEGQDVVIHLAATQHEMNVPDSRFFAFNVGVTRNLLEACQRAGVRRFVYGSTIGVYGQADEHAHLSEDSPCRPDNAYGRSKLAAEQVVREFHPSLSCAIARISETYGPGDMRLLKLFRAIDHGRFTLIGPCTNTRQPIHVDDLSRALLLMAEHPAAVGQTFNVAGTELTTTREFIGKIATALAVGPARLSIPLWPVRTTAVVLETVLRPLGIQPPLHRRRLDFFTKSFRLTTEKLSTQLGHISAVPLTIGLAATSAWYRGESLLRDRRAFSRKNQSAVTPASADVTSQDLPGG